MSKALLAEWDYLGLMRMFDAISRIGHWISDSTNQLFFGAQEAEQEMIRSPVSTPNRLITRFDRSFSCLRDCLMD